jgi:hypothetical protein
VLNEIGVKIVSKMLVVTSHVGRTTSVITVALAATLPNEQREEHDEMALVNRVS